MDNINDSLGMDLRINNGVPEWSTRGADTWSPFKSLSTVTDNIGVLSKVDANTYICTVTIPFNINFGLIIFYHGAINGRNDYYSIEDSRFKLLYKYQLNTGDRQTYITCYQIRDVKQNEVIVFNRDYIGLQDYFYEARIIY